MNAVTASFTDYKVADISLADYGRKEIKLAEAASIPHRYRHLLQGSLRIQGCSKP